MMMDDVKQENQEQKIRAIAKKVKKRIAEVAVEYPDLVKTNGHLPIPFTEKCMSTYELGDGLLYASVLRDRFLYNASAAAWMRWTGHTWGIDIMEENLSAVESVVDKLLDVTGRINDEMQKAISDKNESRKEQYSRLRDRIYSRIARYRTDKGRTMMIKFARTCRDPLAIKGDELDRRPWLLPCANAVVNLKTGESRDGRREDMLFLSSPTEWKGLNEPAPVFEAWLKEVLSDDEDLVTFVQRFLGYAITGLTYEHILAVLWGGGRNGKGTLVELIGHVLGPLAGPIQAEMLLDQGKSRSSAGPSPDIMGLRGLRIAFASETDENRRFSPARVKWLTGGDTLVGRHPHDKYEVRFEPTHTLILMTNHKPSAPDTDFAFWERVRLVPFKLAFVDREPSAANERRAKKGMVDVLKKEAPGILAWLVRGCLAYQDHGLNPPIAVTEATADWRKAENELLDFIEDYCNRDEMAKIKATLLYENFNRWFKANRSPKGVSQTMFGRIMNKRFEKKKMDGLIFYVGIELVKEVPDFESEKDEPSMF